MIINSLLGILSIIIVVAIPLLEHYQYKEAKFRLENYLNRRYFPHENKDGIYLVKIDFFTDDFTIVKKKE